MNKLFKKNIWEFKEFSGILRGRQWVINLCTYPMMIIKITPSVKYFVDNLGHCYVEPSNKYLIE